MSQGRGDSARSSVRSADPLLCFQDVNALSPPRCRTAPRGAMDRRNLLRRHLKPAVKKLGLPATVDFRSFRTMHSSLMSSVGVRPEVTRDNGTLDCRCDSECLQQDVVERTS
jgi:hypothetical protein